jgi:hypothetical protein
LLGYLSHLFSFCKWDLVFDFQITTDLQSGMSLVFKLLLLFKFKLIKLCGTWDLWSGIKCLGWKCNFINRSQQYNPRIDYKGVGKNDGLPRCNPRTNIVTTSNVPIRKEENAKVAMVHVKSKGFSPTSGCEYKEKRQKSCQIVVKIVNLFTHVFLVTF